MRGVLILIALAAALAAPAAAPATFAGAPGLVAYETYEGIYSARPDGTGHRRVAPRGARDPEFSRDGRHLLYQRNYYELWRSRADGTGARRILREPGGRQIHSVAWSPSGRRAALGLLSEEPVPGSDDGEVRTRYGVYVVGIDGRDLRRVGAGSDPAWSPDGRRIAFVTEGGVWLARPDGTGRRRLRRVRGARHPDFSPGGRRLLYLRGAAPARIHVLDLRSGRDRVVPHDSPGRPFGARWTPDGARIAYLHQVVPGEGVWPPTELRTVRPDGSARERVLTFPDRRWADAFSWQAVRARG